MRLIRVLLPATLRGGWMRNTIAVISVAASTALVLSIAGSYYIPPDEGPKAPLGPYDCVIRSGSLDDWEADEQRYGMIPPRPAVAETLLKTIRTDRRVEKCVETAAAKVELFKPEAMFRRAMYHPGETAPRTMLAFADDRRPPGVSVPNWQACLTKGELIVNDNVLTQLGLNVGDQIMVASGGGRKVFRIGASFQTPGFEKKPKENSGARGFFPDQGILKDFGGLLVSRTAFEEISGEPFRVNRVFAILAGGSAAEGFLPDFEKMAMEQKGSMPVCVLDADDYLSHQPAARRRGGFGVLPHMGTVLVSLAAFYIVLCTLCIGAQSRRRQMAVLRALGAGRVQIIGLVFVEAFVLATLGAILGTPIGWFLLKLGVGSAASTESLLTAASAVLPLTAAIVYASAFFAAFPAAWIAAHRHPLEAAEETAISIPRGRPPFWFLPVAVLLLAINPVVSFFPGLSLEARMVFAPLSYIPAVTGLVLLAPWIIRWAESTFRRPTAILLGVRSELLEGQLSGQFWRATAGASAMMIGFGLFVTVHIWGLSMQDPFLVGDRYPDAVAVVFPKGLTEAGVEEVAQIDGVLRSEPMLLHHPTLSDEAFHSLNSKHGWRDLVYLGCDAKAIVDPQKGLISARFIRGNPQEAFRKVKEEHGCLITEELYRQAPERFDVGTELEMQTVDGEPRKFSRPIVGVVKIPGWHLLTKSARMRRGLGRVAAMVFVSPETARADFAGSSFNVFWLELEKEFQEEWKRQTAQAGGRPQRGGGPQIGASSRRGGRPGMGPPRRPPSPLEIAMEKMARKHAAGDARSASMESYVRVADTAAMTESIQGRCDQIIGQMSRLPLIALALSALAVMATLAASVQARCRELGVLRCVGLSRFQLFRLILGEGLLTGIVACLLGGIFGLIAAWTGIYVSSLGWGVSSPFLLPWRTLALGCGVTLAAGLIGAFLPGVTAAMSGPLDLFYARKDA